MELASLIFAPLIVGIIILVIEYRFIQPSINSRGQENAEINDVYFQKNQESHLVTPQQDNAVRISTAFYKLAIVILGGISGVVSAILIRLIADDYYYPLNDPDLLGSIANLVTNSNFFFGIIALFSLVGGAGLAYLVDDSLSKETDFWLRVVASIVFGVAGGFLILLILILAAIVYLFYILHTGEQENSQRRREAK